MTLIITNDQGASEETRNLETVQDVRDQINTWSDPENLGAKIYDEGTVLYDGNAQEYLDQE